MNTIEQRRVVIKHPALQDESELPGDGEAVYMAAAAEEDDDGDDE